ncbi:MAG TPA: hypothetical protein GXZ56_09230 [Bacteroidales bacterium]|nr:hypothetical protein [Bacteroidales bacterium]
MSSDTEEYDVPLNKGMHFPCYSNKATAKVSLAGRSYPRKAKENTKETYKKKPKKIH